MSNTQSATGGPTHRNSKPNQTTNTSVGNSKEAEAVVKDFYHIARDLTLFFCRRIIFGPVEFKILVSLAIIIIGSLLKSYELVPNSYFSLKTNIFNRFFAKLGWAWTMGLLGPFIYLTLVTTHTQYQIFTRHLIRLLIATGVWYVITSIFVRFELLTGSCKYEPMRGASKRVCVSGGYEWNEGYDFSGHTFLLLYAILIINEEVKAYDKGTKKVDQKTKTATAEGGDTVETTEQQRLELFSKLIRILYVALAALTILWEFMLLSTALYFHHTLHKITAAGFAVFFWYITYYVWYRRDNHSLLYPSTPKE